MNNQTLFNPDELPVPKKKAAAVQAHFGHGPISLAAIQKGVIADAEYKKKEIVEYVEWQSNKGRKKRDKKVAVVHLEQMKTEHVFGREHVAWDVHTNEEHGRWWVITNPTNLYSQHEFPSLDYTLSFHIGICARVASKDHHKAPSETRDRLLSSWRRWEGASEAQTLAKEPEDFQAVGVLCRETLIELVKSLQGQIEDVALPAPKAADVVAWIELIINFFAPGDRNRHIRSYLKATAKETWQLANWLVHTGNASAHETQLTVDATGNVLMTFGTVLMKGEAKAPDTCPSCKSHRIYSVYDPDAGQPNGYVNVCEACDWNSFEEPEKQEQ